MKLYSGSFLLLFAVIRSTRTQVCSLSNDCGVIGGKTRLFCKVTAPFKRSNLNWSGPSRDLITGGTILDTAITDLEEASDGFYLTILNTAKNDNGTYICDYSYVRHDCVVTQEDFQALMCEQKVDGHKMIITITYRLRGNLPKISLVKNTTGEAMNGTFDSVIDNGFLKEIVWRSNDLSVGIYNYIVTGDCGSLTACFGTVDTPVCRLSNDCGVIGGKTRLFCKVTAPVDRTKISWFGPGSDLITGGTILDPAITALKEASDGFYLTILNTAKNDNGTYICDYSYVRHDCVVTQEDFQALMCEQKVDGHKMIITIRYRLRGNLPKISLMKRTTGEEISGMFDSVIDNGFLKEIVWRSNDLSVGIYNYTVTGYCGSLTACSGTVDIAVCQIGSDSGVMGGETKLFCKVTSGERPDRGGTKWLGPHGDLILRGVVQSYYIGIIDIEMTIDGFYLIIKNTTKTDLGTYSCGYGTGPLKYCKFELENFQGPIVAPTEMKDWKIALIAIFAIISFLVIAAIVIYRLCLKKRAKVIGRCFAGLSCCCLQWTHQAEQDVNDICLKDAASEK